MRPGAAVATGANQAHCAEHLSRYKVPAFVEFLDALPRTSVGKLSRRDPRART